MLSLRERVEAVVRARPGASAAEVMAALPEAPRKSIEGALWRLCRDGILARRGVARPRGGWAMQYRVTDDDGDDWRPAQWIHPYRARVLAPGARA